VNSKKPFRETQENSRIEWAPQDPYKGADPEGYGACYPSQKIEN